MKVEFDKLGINKLVNVPTALKNLEAKVDDLRVGKLKTVPIELNKLSDAACKEVVKNTKFNKLNAKVNKLKQKIFYANTSIHTNQYNKDKQILKNKIEDTEKKFQTLVFSNNYCFEYKNWRSWEQNARC